MKGARQMGVPAMPRRKDALRRALSSRIVATPSPYAPFLRMTSAVAVLAALVIVVAGQGYLPVTERGRALSYLRSAERSLETLPADERAALSAALGKDPLEVISDIRSGRRVALTAEGSADPGSEIMAKGADSSTMRAAGIEEDASIAEDPGTISLMQADVPEGESSPSPVAFSAMMAPAPPLLPAPVRFVRYTSARGEIISVGFSEQDIPVSIEILPSE